MQSWHFGLPGKDNHTVLLRLQDVTAASLGNEVEAYWCCCWITFEIASCCSVFFLLVWRAVVLLVGVRLQRCFRWWKTCFFFYCFSLCCSLQHHFWSQQGVSKKSNLFFPDARKQSRYYSTTSYYCMLRAAMCVWMPEHEDLIFNCWGWNRICFIFGTITLVFRWKNALVFYFFLKLHKTTTYSDSWIVTWDLLITKSSLQKKEAGPIKPGRVTLVCTFIQTSFNQDPDIKVKLSSNLRIKV